MRRHSEATAALHRSWQLKQKQEEEQQRHVQEERQQAAKAKHEHEQLIEKRRLEVAVAADERAERVRAAHQAKLARADQQAALALQRKVDQAADLKKRSQLVAARNQEIQHKSEQILERKKQALQAKEALEQEQVRNTEAEKQAREAERSQAKARRIVEAQRAQQQAALDLQQKTAYFQSKNAAEEAKLAKKQEESEAVRQAHREEARLKEEVTRQRLEAKARRDEAVRAQLARKTANKMARAELIEAQRQAVLLEMQHIRKDILQQEAWLRDGFEKMEVTGQFELPEELLDLERSGINEAAAFERSRARRSLSQAPSPPMGNPPAREMLGLNGEASRRSVKGAGTMKRPLTAHANIPAQVKGSSYAQQASDRKAASQGVDSWGTSRDGPVANYQDSIKAGYLTTDAKGVDSRLEAGSEAYDEQQQMDQINKLLQEEQVQEVEHDPVLSQAADQHEHQRLSALVNDEREHAQRAVVG
ncbi:hypothetical protein ABBQ38_003131 [Trebouxia sp. C0009 RCD-2024]